FDAGNMLVFATGPLGGLPVISGSRWQVCGKSPATAPEQFSYGNFGGRWGSQLKFAGYDAIAVTGKAAGPVYLFLHDDTAELRDASHLWGQGAIETREKLKAELGAVSVVAIGPAGENMVTMANILADNDASGCGGLGAVMGAKHLKAIVVKGAGKSVKMARPERFRELTDYYRGLARMPFFPSPSLYSTEPHRGHLQTTGRSLKRDPCYGCLTGCTRRTYQAADGSQGKFACLSAMFYQPRAEGYYGEWNDVPFYATKLCDSYGLDTKAVDLMISWLQACYQAGVLTDEATGIPLSKGGSLEFIEALVTKIARREGFGAILAKGISRAAEEIGPAAREQIKSAGYLASPGFTMDYGPRLYITTGLLYAMEPRLPIQQLHEISVPLCKWVSWLKQVSGANLSTEVLRAIARRFWGSEQAADFSTYQGKALAAKKIQEREYATECLILCNFLWPILEMENSPDHVGDPALESRLLAAVTGDDIDEEGLYRIGERVFNLQRAIRVREGHRGREADTLPDYCFTEPLTVDDYFNQEGLVPGRDGQVISRKGMVVDRGEFERMKDEYYGLRQWEVATGLQTREQMAELGLTDVADELARRGRLGGHLIPERRQ
ncbi:MAG: aldehyde ferredoxin oxidoreductase C-terminal domain-containing protein, partial [Chloroflexota bacterium]